MNARMKSSRKDTGFAAFLLVGTFLVIVLWALSPTAQPYGHSRIEWPTSS